MQQLLAGARSSLQYMLTLTQYQRKLKSVELVLTFMNKAYDMRSCCRKVSAVVESIDVQNYVPSKESGECKHDKQAPDLCGLRYIAIHCCDMHRIKST